MPLIPSPMRKQTAVALGLILSALSAQASQHELRWPIVGGAQGAGAPTSPPSGGSPLSFTGTLAPASLNQPYAFDLNSIVSTGADPLPPLTWSTTTPLPPRADTDPGGDAERHAHHGDSRGLVD